MPYSLFKGPHHFFYRKKFARTWIYIRPFHFRKDVPLIHRWVNRPYAHRYWQMQGTLKELVLYLIKQEEASVTITFIVCHGLKPIALFEVYHVEQTEVAAVYASANDDYGIHLLMAPPEELLSLKAKIRNVSENVLATILEMLFSYQAVNRVVAEPDIGNVLAHRLAEKAGFEFQRVIRLTDKTAKLYMITKEQFLKTS